MELRTDNQRIAIPLETNRVVKTNRVGSMVITDLPIADQLTGLTMKGHNFWEAEDDDKVNKVSDWKNGNKYISIHYEKREKDPEQTRTYLAELWKLFNDSNRWKIR